MGFPWSNIDNPMIKYVVQTRAEIDTEKRERDQMLNFIIVTVGGLAFATFLKLPSPSSSGTWPPGTIFCIAVAAMIFVFGLFLVRRDKLQQIADRWFSLECLLKDVAALDSTAAMNNLLETQVCEQLRAKHQFPICLLPPRYLRKDLLLVSPLLAIIYILQLHFTWPAGYWHDDIVLVLVTGSAIGGLCWKPLHVWTNKS